MFISNFFKFIIAVAVSELAGVIGSVFTVSSVSDWYAGLAKPALNPPNWIFGPVWAVLYFLIGVSLYLVWENGWRIENRIFEYKRKAWNPWSERLWTGDWRKANIISVFALQYVLNVFWSYIFFGLRQPGWAFFEIIALWWSIFYVIVNFYRVSKAAAWLLLPYIIWVSFAAYLNYSVWALN